MADLPIYTVDAFSNKPFSGNPAAVCLIPHGQVCGDALLQIIAAEMNISETCYLEHVSEKSDFVADDTFRLRWFTPTNEVDLCGHGTLAVAAVLFQCTGNVNQTLTFMSNSGPLLARRNGDAITLDFPLNPVQAYDRELALPIIKEICDPAIVSDVQYSPKTKKLVLCLKDGVTRDFLESLAPDTRALHASDSTGNVKGVIVTVKADAGPEAYDFLSRYFAPWNGIPEDPVTGSAHTVLADFWSKQLGKTSFQARQCSKRGGDLGVKIVGDRVELTGNATIVLRGKIAVC